MSDKDRVFRDKNYYYNSQLFIPSKNRSNQDARFESLQKYTPYFPKYGY